MDELHNKVALITGGAKGIGLATAEIFIREGCKVIIFDIDTESGEALERKYQNQCLFLKTDVSSSAEIENGVSSVVSTFGTIDFLINNAGIISYANAETCTEQEWDLIMNVNLKSAFLCSKHVIPIMKKQGGVIINVASAQSFISSGNMVHYTTSKSALLGLTRSIAIDFAPSIRSIAVCPGTVDTPMARNAWAQAINPDAIYEDSMNMHVLKRIGRPEEVGELIAFLCTSKAGFITGQAIRIDGGLGINVPGSVDESSKVSKAGKS